MEFYGLHLMPSKHIQTMMPVSFELLLCAIQDSAMLSQAERCPGQIWISQHQQMFHKNYWTLQFACRKLPLVKIKVPVPISHTSERGPGQRLVIKSCFCFVGLTFYLLYCQRFSSLANNKFKYFFYYCMGCIVMNEYYL